MSGFYILVIGNNTTELLAPYHAFTGYDFEGQHVEEIDITEEFLDISGKDMLESKLGIWGISSVPDESMVDTEGKHKFGYAIIKDGKLIKAVERTNPNTRWDECWLGCRRPGLFKLKPHRHGVLAPESIDELKKRGEENLDSLAVIAPRYFRSVSRYSVFVFSFVKDERSARIFCS